MIQGDGERIKEAEYCICDVRGTELDIGQGIRITTMCNLVRQEQGKPRTSILSLGNLYNGKRWPLLSKRRCTETRPAEPRDFPRASRIPHQDSRK